MRRSDRQPREDPKGFRVLHVEVWDVTPGKGPKREAMAGLVIACDGRGLSKVRAALTEMGEALDGVVLVT
jgi:hypothetical protein